MCIHGEREAYVSSINIRWEKKPKVVKGLTVVVLIKKKLYIYSVCFYHCLKYFVETWVSLSVIWRKCPGYGLWKGRFRPKGIPFLGFRNEKWHCFHYVKYTKGKRNLSLQLRTVKGPKRHYSLFYDCKKAKNTSWWMINSYLKDAAFTAVKE